MRVIAKLRPLFVPFILFCSLSPVYGGGNLPGNNLSQGGTGFCQNGVYPTTSRTGLNPSRKVTLWGSYCEEGDRGTGSYASKPFPAKSAVSFYLAGYADGPKLHIFAENLKTGQRILLRPKRLPREFWQLVTFSLPAAWQDQEIRVLAEDAETGLGGWLGLSEPSPRSILNAGALRRILRTSVFIYLAALAIFLGSAFLGKLNPTRRDVVLVAIVILTLGFSAYLTVWMSLLASKAGILTTCFFGAVAASFLYWFRQARRQAFKQAINTLRSSVLLLISGITLAFMVGLCYGEIYYPVAIVGISVLLIIVWFAVERRIAAVTAQTGVVAIALAAYEMIAVYPGQQLPSSDRASIISAIFICAGSLSAFLSTASKRILAVRALSLVTAWLFSVAATVTMIYQWQPKTRLLEWEPAETWIFCIPACAIGYAIYRLELKRLSASQAAVLVGLILLLTSVMNNLHFFMVDGSSYVPGTSNLQLQDGIQNSVIRGDAGALPHTYRFLPNAFVRWLQLAGMPFGPARDLYRLIFGLLLSYALYRYSRLYTTYLGGLLSLILVTAVYPISFEYYAGQLTDPLSHLSFVLALIFLETVDFPFLLTTLLVGSLAKETVLALMGYYVLFCYRERGYRYKAVLLCLSSLTVYFGVRLFVLRGNMHYSQISGVTLQHVSDNWAKYPQWLPVFLLTGAAFSPFLILAWKRVPLSLKRQAVYLLLVLFISSLFFSWLHEGRNYMPATFVLAVAASICILQTAGFKTECPEPTLVDERKENAGRSFTTWS